MSVICKENKTKLGFHRKMES